MRIAIALVSALALAACGSAEDAEQSEPSAAIEPGPKDMLDLQANGLTVPAQDGEETFEVPFGSQREATEITLASVLGDVVEQVGNAECPVGPLEMTSHDGMVLYFRDDAFVGYTARAPYVPDLTRAEMLADPAVSLVEDSTLGEEFLIGTAESGIAGLFDGEGEDARVATMWAGMTCVAR